MTARILSAAREGSLFVVAVLLDERYTRQEMRGISCQETPRTVRLRAPDPHWMLVSSFDLGTLPEAAIEAALVEARDFSRRRMDALGDPVPHLLSGQLIDLETFVPAGEKDPATNGRRERAAV